MTKTISNDSWGSEERQFTLIARTLFMDYFSTVVELSLGLFMLPFNIWYLGQSAYGLWVLTASVTFYFSMLNLGYGSALVRFAAQYRAKRDELALNEVASTMFFLFAAIGIATYLLAIAIAFNLETIFSLTPEQARTGRQVLLIISIYISLGFPFSVFGGVINGFQRKYLNGIVGITTSILVAFVNVMVLTLGYGLVELVFCTTLVRILSYFGYRLNAYRVFPALKIRLSNFRLSRLREITVFSAFMLLIDLANKLNYSTDVIVVGAFLSTALVAVWAVAQRLIEIAQRLTDQLNGALFPVIVDSHTVGDANRLSVILLQGTRISLAMVLPLSIGLVFLAEPLVLLWVGPDFVTSASVVGVLALVLVFRVGNATATTLLKGAGNHRLLALSNLAIGIVNVGLSIAFVRPYGLIGVAVATLIPLGAISMLVLFPAACRRAALPISKALAGAVWPALWPAILMAGFLGVSRRFIGTGIAWLCAEAITAGAIYISLFLWLAIDRSERHWYVEKFRRMSAGSRLTAARVSQ